MLKIHSSTTHGLRNHRLYSIWANILTRIRNENSDAYANYGGRGISICSEWEKDFHSFYVWSMRNGYEEHLTIDRIDNDGNYEPSNCRWDTRKIQARNSRKIRSNNKSGYRGVCKPSGNPKHIAQIFVNGKRKYLGSFHTAFGAAIAYDKYVIENNLEHTRNFTDKDIVDIEKVDA